MPNHLVAGRLLPDAVAGHLALELCNTKALWGLPGEKDYLADWTALELWAREHGVISVAAPWSARQRAAALGGVRRLRLALYAAVTEGATLAPVHAFVARAVARAAYGPAGLEAGDGPAVIVDRLALAAHSLLSEHGLVAVTRCASPACGWVFLDPTHRRRWCVMAVCGNRAKARRYVERRRAVPAR